MTDTPAKPPTIAVPTAKPVESPKSPVNPLDSPVRAPKPVALKTPKPVEALVNHWRASVVPARHDNTPAQRYRREAMLDAADDLQAALDNEGDTGPAPFVDVVFDGPPGALSGRFVEVEAPDGRSVAVGEWIDRPDTPYWALRIPTIRSWQGDEFRAAVRALLEERLRGGAHPAPYTNEAAFLERLESLLEDEGA